MTVSSKTIQCSGTCNQVQCYRFSSKSSGSVHFLEKVLGLCMQHYFKIVPATWRLGMVW